MAVATASRACSTESGGRAEAALGEGTDRLRRPACCAASSSARTTASRRPPWRSSRPRASPTCSPFSGQNVVLLAVLAAVVLAVLGVPLRSRLAWILVLIAIYVPVAGAGPSIQRAGVMGAAGIVAALAGRPRSRWYALLLAAARDAGA